MPDTRNANFQNRIDTRTPTEFQQNLFQGARNEAAIGMHFFTMVNRLFEMGHTNFRIVSCQMLDKLQGGLVTGDFEDQGDYFIVMADMETGGRRAGVIDIKSVQKPHDIFSYKQVELERCRDRFWPIILGQRFGLPGARLRIFNIREIYTILRRLQPYPLSYMGGKKGYQFRVQNFTNWLDYDSFTDIGNPGSYEGLRIQLAFLWADLGAQMAEFQQVLNTNFTRLSDDYFDFAAYKNQCCDCTVGQCYKQVIQSEGNALNPTFMFIGEAPGAEELDFGRPFVGRAGKRLRAELKKCRLINRANTLISNVMPCRPLNNSFPRETDKGQVFKFENGQPLGWQEVDGVSQVQYCFNRWLVEEIKIVKPKIIVTLGNPALKWICGEKGITRHRGQWKYLPEYNAWAFSTFHPSYVIRAVNEGKTGIELSFMSDIATVDREAPEKISQLGEANGG